MKLKMSLGVLAGLGIAVSLSPSFGIAQVPCPDKSSIMNNEDRSRLEWLNDGWESEPSVLAIMQVLPGMAVGRITFQPKKVVDWTIRMGGPNTFHLTAADGSPVTVTNIRDCGHHTTTSGLICVFYEPGKPMGAVTFLATKSTPPIPPPRFYIDACE